MTTMRMRARCRYLAHQDVPGNVGKTEIREDDVELAAPEEFGRFAPVPTAATLAPAAGRRITKTSRMSVTSSITGTRMPASQPRISGVTGASLVPQRSKGGASIVVGSASWIYC